MFSLAPFYDGVPQVTQCSIPSHTSFRYTIKAANAGTHWWHSHVGMQRADGVFGALVVRETLRILPLQIQRIYEHNLHERILIMQDWKHKTGTNSFSSFHHSFGDNKPLNILINGKGKDFNQESLFWKSDIVSELGTEAGKIASAPFEVFNVEKHSRYRFRLINSGFLNCPLEISIDNHTLLIIASDGHYIEPISVDSLISYAGERFDFVIDCHQPIGNYWIRVKGLLDCDERFFSAHQGAVLHYVGAKNDIPNLNLVYEYQRDGIQMNSLNKGPGHIDSVAIVEATALEPDTSELLEEHTEYKFFIYYDFNDINFPQFNNPNLYSISNVSNQEKFYGPQLNHISMEMPSKPFLIWRERNNEYEFCNSSSLLEQNIDCEKQFCSCNHILQVPLNATIEVILVDEGFRYDANHPFHLHGHDFRVVGMGRIQSTGVTIEQVTLGEKFQVLFLNHIKKGLPSTLVIGGKVFERRFKKFIRF